MYYMLIQPGTGSATLTMNHMIRNQTGCQWEFKQLSKVYFKSNLHTENILCWLQTETAYPFSSSPIVLSFQVAVFFPPGHLCPLGFCCAAPPHLPDTLGSSSEALEQKLKSLRFNNHKRGSRVKGTPVEHRVRLFCLLCDNGLKRVSAVLQALCL